MKADVLDELVDGLPAKFKSLSPAKQKAWVDSTETLLRKKAVSSLKRRIEDILQARGE